MFVLGLISRTTRLLYLKSSYICGLCIIKLNGGGFGKHLSECAIKVPMLPIPMICIRRVRGCSVGSSWGKSNVLEAEGVKGSSWMSSAPSRPRHHDQSPATV